jgi:hypothetical protein
MQSSPQSASSPFAPHTGGLATPRSTEDRVYQVVTVVSILMVLGSLWLF